ncbi:hypothetical protein MTATph1_CDS0176 [Moorella phage MTATph1]
MNLEQCLDCPHFSAQLSPVYGYLYFCGSEPLWDISGCPLQKQKAS